MFDGRLTINFYILFFHVSCLFALTNE